MSTGMWFAISNDGVMTGQEMLNELREHRICPVMTYEEDGKQIVPIFSNNDLAQDFARRNTPRDYTIGTMEAHPSDLIDFKDQGYEPIEINWPKKRATTVVVIHLNREVETHNKGYRRNT